MKSMFCVSRGSYSDYRVLAVFEDEADANAWAAAMSGSGSYDEPQVEEMILVEKGEAPRRVTTYRRSIEFWDNGKIDDQGIHSHTDWAIDSYEGPPPVRPHLRFVRAPCHHNAGGRLDIRGSSAESVDKVGNDRIAAWRAGAWITTTLNEWEGE